MSIWNDIYNDINNLPIELVCVFIGSAMGYYDELTEKNNQQYPCFLNKFNNKKLIILIDPELEKNLKIEEYFILKGNPLISHNQFSNENNFRVFSNSEIKVYALNESINYIKYYSFNENEPTDTTKIYTIINYCLNKNIKLILQDYSGSDTTYFYSKLFNKYNRDDLLNNINMDVTQIDGGCRINLTPELIQLDYKRNFIQEKFMELSKMKKTELFNKISNSRIDIFIYPICFYYSQIIKMQEFDLDKNQIYKIGIISTIYNVDFDEKNLDLNYLKEKLEILINNILKDIINSKNLDVSFYDFIMNYINNDDRRKLYETMKILKY